MESCCNEECLNCRNKNLCLLLLEYTGMVFKDGDKIRFDCEEIKHNPEYYKMMIDKWLNSRGEV